MKRVALTLLCFVLLLSLAFITSAFQINNIQQSVAVIGQGGDSGDPLPLPPKPPPPPPPPIVA